MPSDQQKKYQALKKQWYAKLKKSGFNDIENDKGLIDYVSAKSTLLKKQGPEKIEIAYSFYSAAREMMHKHTFKSSLESTVWAHYSEGDSPRKIARILGITPYKATKIVNELIEEMKKGGYLNE